MQSLVSNRTLLFRNTAMFQLRSGARVHAKVPAVVARYSRRYKVDGSNTTGSNTARTVRETFSEKCSECKYVLQALQNTTISVHNLPSMCSAKKMWLEAWHANQDCLDISELVSLDGDKVNDEELRSLLMARSDIEFGRRDTSCGLCKFK